LLQISAVLPGHFKSPGAFRKDEREAFQEDDEVVPRIKSPMEKKMTKKNAAESHENARRDEPKLDSRYGEIGISAVAAALQYANKTDNAAADAPTVGKLDNKWLAELAAA
jgi:hypothetical protein